MQEKCKSCKHESTSATIEPCKGCLNEDDKPNYEKKLINKKQQ